MLAGIWIRPEAGLAGTCQMYVHDVCKAVFGALVIAVFVQGNRRIAQYERLLNNSYANTENKSLVSLHHMLLAFVVTSQSAGFLPSITSRTQPPTAYASKPAFCKVLIIFFTFTGRSNVML